MQRFVTLWTLPGFVSEHYVSENEQELNELIQNLKKNGVEQYSTYPIGPRSEEFSTNW